MSLARRMNVYDNDNDTAGEFSSGRFLTLCFYSGMGRQNLLREEGTNSPAVSPALITISKKSGGYTVMPAAAKHNGFVTE